MTFVRKEVRNLGGAWSDTLLWYARAVALLQKKPITDSTSWLFLGAMHGFQAVMWEYFGIIGKATALPPNAIQSAYWEQCQHQSWFFLPWHRGYLYAFEEIIRSTIISAGGPSDWALPYWNYSKAGDPAARTLPPEFATKAWPDGSDNPLFVPRRWGSGTQPIEVDPRSASIKALNDPQFAGGDSDIPPGFGGPASAFHHGPESQLTNGGLETLPHNAVHGDVGGAEPGKDPNKWQNQGLMSNPIFAAIDPIFWLHHANIDRLWKLWTLTSGHANPTDKAWLDGPKNRGFVMPLISNQEWRFTPRMVLDTTKAPLGYIYDDEIVQTALPLVSTRLALLGFQASEIQTLSLEDSHLPSTNAPELIGASAPEISVAGRTGVDVKFDKPSVSMLRASLTPLESRPAKPPRVFLKIEGIRSTANAAVFHVYVDLPPQGSPLDHPDVLAGTLSLFGVSAATHDDSPTSGNGVNQVFDITEIVDRLHLAGSDLSKITVQFVPSNPASDASRMTIRRLSVFKLDQ